MGYCCADCAYMDLNDTNSYGDYWCGYYRKYYPGSDSACSNFKGDGSSSGCYITTVMCDILGYEDHCFYLNKLRAFRDNFMRPNPKYSGLLEEYNIIGVLISNMILKDIEKFDIAEYIFNHYIKQAVDLIEIGKYSESINIYKQMVNFLKERYALNSVSV